MFKKYKWVFLFVYFGLYLVILFFIFALIQSGVTFTANDVLDLVRKYGLMSDGIQSRIDYINSIGYDWALNFGAAWVATKFTEPIRLVLTFFITPKSAELIQSIRGKFGGKKAFALPLLICTSMVESDDISKPHLNFAQKRKNHNNSAFIH